MSNNDEFADYDRASIMAWNTIIDAGIYKFPFSLIDLYKRFSTIRLKSFTDYAEELNSNIKNNHDKVSADDIALMLRSNDGATQRLFKKKYNVLFDSDCSKKPVQRIRFTLAHELGHYVLRHFYDKSTNNFRRNSSNDGKNSKFEHEANRFARELLAPVFLVEKFPIYSTKEYIGKCLDISPESASNVISFYKKNAKRYFIDDNGDDFSAYRKYFYKVNYFEGRQNSYMPNNKHCSKNFAFTYCKKCKCSQQTFKNQKHCIICNSTDLFFVVPTNFFYFHEQFEENSIILNNLDDNHIVIPDYCPNCNTPIIDPELNNCKKCGYIIRNTCKSNYPCNLILLPRRANFCPVCEEQTTKISI